VTVALAARSLRKRFGRRAVIDGLVLEVHEGETYGFLGRNGAGKSTVIHMFLGVLRPDGGEVELLGRRAATPPPAWRRDVGFVAQEPRFDPWATARDLGAFLRPFYPTWDDAHFTELLGVLGVPVDQKSETLSVGMRTRLALALALAHRPRVLILDEPTAGLDPIARRVFQDILRETARAHARTTFFSSHNIDDIERLADRVGVLDGARLRYEGPIGDVTDSVRTVTLDGWYDPHAPPPAPPGFELLRLTRSPRYAATYRAPPAAWEAAALPPERVARLPFEDAVVALMTPREMVA
jgi:ABC-2 type transport system ATP-binding protein